VRTTPDARVVLVGEAPIEQGGAQMAEITVEAAGSRSAAVPMQAPGSAFLALMAGLWGAFVALLATSPSTLDDAYEWLRELPIVWEALMWLLTLPWTVAYLAYETGWEHWARVALVALIVAVHLCICSPRVPRTRDAV
jgi:cytochrome bd-type quinol oxidase subunit 2